MQRIKNEDNQALSVKPWEQEETELAFRLYKKGKNCREISIILNRSYGSVAKKISVKKSESKQVKSYKKRDGDIACPKEKEILDYIKKHPKATEKEISLATGYGEWRVKRTLIDYSVRYYSRCDISDWN